MMFHRRVLSTTGKRWLLLVAVFGSLLFASITYMQFDRRQRGQSLNLDDKTDSALENKIKEVLQEKRLLRKKPLLRQRDTVPASVIAENKRSIITKHDPKAVCRSPSGNPNKATFDVSDMSSSFTFNDLVWDGDVGVWDAEAQKKFAANHDAARSRKLKVFVVPFSHSDPGWLMTVDEYLMTYTKNTLDLVLERLQLWKEMTFIWAEVSFFELWWGTINDEKKSQVRALIDSGRLEIVNGGYVMPDEASTHYYAVIHQYIYGHQWLQQHLNVTPRHGFSIDPFGYSSTMPYLLKNVGFQSIFIQRVHYIIRKRLLHAKASQFSWQQPWDIKNKEAMFTYLSHASIYDIKHTCGQDINVCLQFDYQFAGLFNNDSMIVPAFQLLEEFRKTAQFYPHNAILFPIGMDFRWTSTAEWDAKYQSYRFIMDFLNNNPDNNIEMKFGTYNDYYQEVFRQMGSPDKWQDLPSVTGDFFPYCDRTVEYWTGYFTSHPFQKALNRDLENHLRLAEILFTVSKLRGLDIDTDGLLPTLQLAAKNLGLYQHHDAITGTSKQAVSNDYEDRLFRGISAMYDVIQYAVTTLLWPTDSKHEALLLHGTRSTPQTLPLKQIINLKDQPVSKRLIVVNPLASARMVAVDIVVDTEHVVIQDADGNVVPYQISLLLDPVQYQGEVVPGAFRVTFFVQFKSLSLRSFSIRGASPSEAASKGQSFSKFFDKTSAGFTFDKPFRMENKFMEADFSSTTGLLQSLIDSSGKKHIIRLDFKRYESARSGAYLFWPNGIADMVPYPHQVRLFDGDLYQEIQIVLPGVLRHTVRLFKSDSELGQSLHVENVDNLPNTGQNNVEAVMRLSTDIKNKFLFHTDSNGFQMVKRKASHDLPMQANYYPATTMAFLQDDSTRLTLHIGTPHGIGSQDIGQIEVMFDRFLGQDDARGVEEALRDPRTVRTTFRIQLETDDFCTVCDQHLATSLAGRINLDLNYPSYVLSSGLAPTEPVLDDILTPILPCNMHLVMLKPKTYRVNDTTIGLVLHQFGTDCVATADGDGNDCAQSNTVDLSKFLNYRNFSSYNRTTFNFIDVLSIEKKDIPLTVESMKIAAFTLDVN